jgi:hypothetical protein
MLNILSILVGVVAGLLAFVGLIPIISLVNWIAFPIALFGLVLGVLSDRNEGRNLNLIILAVSGLRLFLTGGIL